MDNVIKFPVKEATEDFTIKVKAGAAPFGWRVKLGIALIVVATAIMGIKFDVE